MCHKGKCVDVSSVTKPPTPCSPNPCLNGGICKQVNSLYVCNCNVEYWGLNCQNLITTTTTTTSTTTTTTTKPTTRIVSKTTTTTTRTTAMPIKVLIPKFTAPLKKV
jgi:hypothetical protein